MLGVAMAGIASRKTFKSRLNFMVKRLRADILSGVYRQGEFLPSEKELVSQFQLSNKSVRKGLEQLIAEQLIVRSIGWEARLPLPRKRLVRSSHSAIIPLC